MLRIFMLIQGVILDNWVTLLCDRRGVRGTVVWRVYWVDRQVYGSSIWSPYATLCGHNWTVKPENVGKMHGGDSGLLVETHLHRGKRRSSSASADEEDPLFSFTNTQTNKGMCGTDWHDKRRKQLKCNFADNPPRGTTRGMEGMWR